MSVESDVHCVGIEEVVKFAYVCEATKNPLKDDVSVGSTAGGRGIFNMLNDSEDEVLREILLRP